jgi:protein-S-isoprenylcysteine O-methyltransferase Ste14
MRRGKNAYAEVDRPGGLLMSLAALGTLAFFAEALLTVYAGFTGQVYLLVSVIQLEFPSASSVQVLGLAIMGAGFLVFVWSVIARGRHSVSWEMSDDHALITWGPYKYVRHPSYLGYFLMFTGLLLTWLNLVALIPLVAIPGYAKIAVTEEELLKQRFGDEYLKYMESTGRFIPKCS